VIVKNRKISRRSGGKLIDLFEVTAALEHDISPAPQAAPTPARVVGGVMARSASSAAIPAQPQSTPAAPATRQPQYDWKGSLPRVSEQSWVPVAPAIPAAPTVAKSPTATASAASAALSPTIGANLAENAQSKFLNLLQKEFRDVKERVEMPTRELRLLTEELRHALATAAPRDPIAPGMDSNSSSVHDYLLQCGFDKAEARRLLIAALAQIKSEPSVPELMQTLRRLVVQEMRCTGGVRFARGRATRIALVGPAGAGKTTTLLKLGVIAAIRSGRKVGILSGDSVRLGAHSALEVFGRTSGMPVFPVFSAADLDAVAPHAAHLDLLLLDTAGRPPQPGDADADRQLALVQAFAPDETLLTLSATTRCRELENQCSRFQAYRPGSLALTRLDECMELGALHALARRTGLPLSYLCDGPSIPEHIQTAKPHHMAHLLLPETSQMRSLATGV
jgi:flagellar biosynthesis GTPase FlhF